MFSELIFLRPWWLLLLPCGALLAYWITRSPTDNWLRVCDARLLPALLVGAGRSRSLLTWVFIVGGWTLAVLALSGPAWDREKIQLYQSVAATIVVFDLSRSMNATDVLPSRIERARYKALELVESMAGRAIGLVAFAGDAHDVTPVSDDVATVIHLIQFLRTDIMPLQGSNASEGLRRAGDLLQGSGYQSGTVILLTDGIDRAAYGAARELRAAGYRLSVIGVGSSVGAPVQFASGDYLRDAADELIIARVDHGSLRELAQAGGGRYQLISGEHADLQALAGDADSVLSSLDSERLETVQWRDRGAWLALALLPLAALLFRRGWLVALAWMCIAGPDAAMALEWRDLWQRPDQRAAAAVLAGEYENPSIQAYPSWHGIARYRQADYDHAAQEFSKSADAVGHYNHGNALAWAGNLPAAIEQYRQALAFDAEFEDAKFNLDLVQQLLDQQRQGQSDPQPAQRDDVVPANAGESGAEAIPQEDAGGAQRQDNEHLSQANEPGSQPPLGSSDETDARSEPEAPRTALQNREPSAVMREEQLQAVDQLLRQVKADPGGLLRRKFYYDSHSRESQVRESQPW